MDENQIGSNRVQDNFAEVLADVEHDGVSYVVMRYKKPAAVIVPIWWYEQAKLATGGAP